MINRPSDSNIDCPWPVNLSVANRIDRTDLTVPSTVDKANASLQLTANNPNASVQLWWTDGRRGPRLSAVKLDNQHDSQEAAAAMEVTATVGQRGSRPQGCKCPISFSPVLARSDFNGFGSSGDVTADEVQDS